MRYRKDLKSGNNLSILGFGCMRLPGRAGHIDQVKSEKLISQAYDRGVNYYDTAYSYPGVEEAVGEILERLKIREKIYLATKLPHGLCRQAADFDKIFGIQKQRLRTDYIDYYLIHNITTFRQWEGLCELGIREWIAGKKASGEIRQLGFSFHGSNHEFNLLLEHYDWDFVQIQYNYINTNYQAGTAGLQKAAQKGLPVIIMEPLLGGKLAGGLPEEAVKLMQAGNPSLSPAMWGFRWLWNQQEVTVVLSGMNEQEQLDENVNTASDMLPDMLTKQENDVIGQVVNVFNKSYKIPCTGCGYCMPCPQGIDIPANFAAYNTSYAIGYGTGIFQYVISSGGANGKPHFADVCIKCGKCQKHCPQKISIPAELKKVRHRLQLPGMKLAMAVYRRIR